jgi:prepilin-type N-terminal cleavage/methylation domain-containing protein
MGNNAKDGFTLIELLIVIGVIAVLAVVVILLLNPAELLREARDSQRISDLATMKNAISLYSTDVANPNIGQLNSVTEGVQCFVTVCNVSGNSTFEDPANSNGAWQSDSNCDWAPSTYCGGFTVEERTGNTSVAGNGWVAINFASMTSGSPIGKEPTDPINQPGTCQGAWSTASLGSCALFYSYVSDGKNYKLTAFMESIRYANGGTKDVESGDGGINPYVYEVGTNLNL